EELHRLRREGDDLYRQGKLDEALARLHEAQAVAAALAEPAAQRDVLESIKKISTERNDRLEALARAERIERQLAEGQQLLQSGKGAEAKLKFVEVLGVDPHNPRAAEGQTKAEEQILASTTRQTREAAFARGNVFPNEKPILTFWQMPGPVVERPTLALHGVATDDRGLVRMEYRVDGRLVRRQELPAIPRNQRFDEEFSLQAGQNQVSVTAVDTSDAFSVAIFDVTRQLRFYESKAFLPSAGATALGLLGAGLVVQHARRRRALHRRFNPYIAGAPVMADNMFFGRRKLLNRIMNVLHHNSLMI